MISLTLIGYIYVRTRDTLTSPKKGSSLYYKPLFDKRVHDPSRKSGVEIEKQDRTLVTTAEIEPEKRTSQSSLYHLLVISSNHAGSCCFLVITLYFVWLVLEMPRASTVSLICFYELITQV